MTKFICIAAPFFLFFLQGSAMMAHTPTSYAAHLIAEPLKKDAHSVVRFEDYRVDIPSYDKIVVTHKKAITLLSGQSDANLLVLVYNSFRKINVIKGRIYDANGDLVRQIRKKEITDQSAVSSFSLYEDNRVKWIKVQHNEYPYTVEFEYKYTINDFMYYPAWSIQGYGMSVEKAIFTISAADRGLFDYKALNTDLVPTEKMNGQNAVVRWSVAELPAIKKVPYSPPPEKTLPIVLLKPNRFKLGKYEGRMTDWESFGRFLNDLNKDHNNLSDEMTAQVKTMTASAKSDREKIDILYRYLQDNTRYISVQLGVGGWRAFDAKYVEKHKYGDCKALTWFMKSMLEAADITACPVMIGAGNEKSDALISEDFVYPGFNHVILHVPSEDCWLECTSSYSPPNYIGAFNQNRKALRLTANGGELVQTPAFQPEDAKSTNKSNIILTENGDARIVNEGALTGPLQGQLRYRTFEQTKEELKEWFLENSHFPSAFVGQLEFIPDKDRPSVAISYEIDVKKYAAKSGRRLFVPLNLVNPYDDVPEKTEHRRQPIEVTKGFVYEDELTFHLPEGYELESGPDEDIVLDTPYGKYRLETTTDSSKIQCKRRLEMWPVSLPAAEYEDFRSFRKEVAEWDATKLVLVKKRT